MKQIEAFLIIYLDFINFTTSVVKKSHIQQRYPQVFSNKVGRVFPIVIRPEFRRRHYRDNDRREDPFHYTSPISVIGQKRFREITA